MSSTLDTLARIYSQTSYYDTTTWWEDIMKTNRAGNFRRMPEGYDAFIPKPLPPDNLDFDENLLLLLSKADRALAKLDGITEVLPNPDLFVAMYIKKEALLSSQIEGTQASLRGVLEFEADMKPKEDVNEIREVVNYIQAMGHGMEKLTFAPFSLDLLNEVHRFLIKGTRGGARYPGNIRTEQNWIGVPGTTIYDAIFVPPPPENVSEILEALMDFVTKMDKIPSLVKVALIHAQFETIHPYYDGNGRMGRLLITFYLYYKGILSRPLLYLSFYLKKNQQEYYEILNSVRIEGNWERWIEFFLKGVIETSESSIETARKIIFLQNDLKNRLVEHSIGGVASLRFIDFIFGNPIVSSSTVAQELSISRQTATSMLKKFEDAGIIAEITGQKRFKKYVFDEYLRIIQEGIST